MIPTSFLGGKNELKNNMVLLMDLTIYLVMNSMRDYITVCNNCSIRIVFDHLMTG